MKKIAIIILILIILVLGLIFIKNHKENMINPPEYVIVTDQKYITMQNDGGSNYNVYYELTGSSIVKLEDHYIGFKGYEYERKIIYEKELNSDLKKKIINLIDSLLEKEDTNDNNNYSPYKIKISNKEKEIYNENSIELLKSLLKEIDNL